MGSETVQRRKQPHVGRGVAPGMDRPAAASAPVTVWLPTDPPRPAPELLTGEEAAVYLRVDDMADGGLETLRRYRDSGRLKGVQIGRTMKYRLEDLRRFVQEMAQ